MSSHALAAIGTALLLVPAAAAAQPGTTRSPGESAAPPVALRPVPAQRPATQGATLPTGGAEPGPASPVAPDEGLAGVLRGLRAAPERDAPSRDRPIDVGPTGWTWPLTPRPAIVRGFDVGPHRWSPGHRGVDLDADPADAVIAPAGGVVTFAGVVVGRPVVVVAHPGGIRTSYESVQAAIPVGATVRRGAVVGHLVSVGNHCGAAVCLHWGARRDGSYIDPLTLLGRPRIVLLPLRPP